MKIVCSYSSLEFTVEHFPGYFSSRESCHPIFHLPQRKLIPYLSKWSSGELTPIDSYLLFLAALRSSDHVEFRVPAVRTLRTPSIIAKNMEPLFRAIIHLNAVANPSVIFPRYVITESTRDLDNVSFWIDNWEESYADFKAGRSREYDDRKLLHRENALQRLIKNPHKKVSEYASQIADWAYVAADFDSIRAGQTIHPITSQPISTAEKWRWVIVQCARQENIFAIPQKDIERVLEWCETELEIGTIFSNTLFQILRRALEKKKNFLGFGDLDIGETTYQILKPDDSAEDANLSAMISAAPEEEPRPEQYPTKFEFMKAKLRWDMAKKHSRSAK